jgi:hypothetical protein
MDISEIRSWHLNPFPKCPFPISPFYCYKNGHIGNENIKNRFKSWIYWISNISISDILIFRLTTLFTKIWEVLWKQKKCLRVEEFFSFLCKWQFVTICLVMRNMYFIKHHFIFDKTKKIWMLGHFAFFVIFWLTEKNLLQIQQKSMKYGLNTIPSNMLQSITSLYNPWVESYFCKRSKVV